jgi:hypothetical protein
MTTRESFRRPVSLREFVALVGAVALAWQACDEWIAGAAVLVLWIVWRVPTVPDGPPVLSMALTFQWVQGSIGIFYHGLTGRMLQAMVVDEYRQMTLIALGCVTALAFGLRLGLRALPDRFRDSPLAALTLKGIVIAYLISVLLGGAINEYAWEVPDLTQAILAVNFIHLALVFLILRRLSSPTFQWPLIIGVLSFEIVLGMTGFFAGFREPIIMLMIVLVERFNPRRVQQWVVLAGLFVFLAGLGAIWMNVRTGYRADLTSGVIGESREARVNRLGQLSRDWLKADHSDIMGQFDVVVDRMWTVYYPALVLRRVPKSVPHTDGAIITGALVHVLSPRVFFPTKATLGSDSAMVRKYAGVFVAGDEQDTSIAFGYAAESYLDFGVPLMFVPVLLYGAFLGLAFSFFTRMLTVSELRIGLITMIFWLSLYLFERSWVKTLGLSCTLMLYLGTPAIILDRYISRRLVGGTASPVWDADEGGAAPVHES